MCGSSCYHLALPPKMEKIHNIFHVSMLRRYWYDPSHVLTYETVEMRPDFSYKEEPEILDRDVKVLRRKSVTLVKVLWRNHAVEEAT